MTPASGRSVHASSTNCCSTSSFILLLPGRRGWGRGVRAASMPSVTKRLRTRATVFGLAPQAVTMASSACSSPCRASASKRRRAWVSLRAAALPPETNRSSSVRSSSVRVTRYFSMAEPLSLSGTSWPKPQETGFRVTRQSKIDKSLVSLPALRCPSALASVFRHGAPRTPGPCVPDGTGAAPRRAVSRGQAGRAGHCALFLTDTRSIPGAECSLDSFSHGLS